MFGITASFTNIAIMVTTVFLLVLLFNYFRLKRDVNLSDIEKALRHLKLSTGFLAVLIFVAMLYLQGVGFYPDIDVSPAMRETAFQNLVQNQQKMGRVLQRFSEIVTLLFTTSSVYLFSVATFVGQLQREKRRRAFMNDAATKRPLGLEID